MERGWRLLDVEIGLHIDPKTDGLATSATISIVFLGIKHAGIDDFKKRSDS